MQWVLARNFKVKAVFTEKFICELHSRMCGNIWSWAGKFRKTNKNIGVEHFRIPLALKVLCDDALYWVEHDTYPPDEIAIRFKHTIVSIHCFPDGNGRHSRLMGDIIVAKLFRQPLFSWGSGNLSKTSDARAAYLQAVKLADQGNYTDLLTFARS